MIFVVDVIFITRQPNDRMLSVWKENMFCPLKSCTIILKFNHDPISILSRQVHILNNFTYLSHSDVFKTALHIFLGNSHSCFPTFLFYYRFTKKLSKNIYENLIHYIIMIMTYVLMLWISNSSEILNFAYVVYLILPYLSIKSFKLIINIQNICELCDIW